jgi:hypothetical protein
MTRTSTTCSRATASVTTSGCVPSWRGTRRAARLLQDDFLALASGHVTWDVLQKEDAVEVAGDPEILARFLACFDLIPPRVHLHMR